MDRRTYLRALSLAGAAGIAGCFDWMDGEETGTPTRSPTPTGSPTATPSVQHTATADLADRFGTVIDMVEDEGVDPNGNEPIDEALRTAAGDDTLLEFPPGTYRASRMLVLEDVRNFGITGTGESRGDVRFVHPEGFSDRFLNVRSGRDVLVHNLTLDQTDDDVTNSGLVVLNDDGTLIENVEVAGFTPSEEQGTVDLIVQITAQQGTGIVRRFVDTGGGQVGVYPASYPGVFSGPQHAGTLRMIDCHVQECGSNGVYASRTNGGVQIIGGTFKNNDVSQVRICGEGSFIRDARIVVDTDNTTKARGSYDTVRGLWWESGWQGKTGGYVANCDFHVGSAANPRALLQIDGTGGSVTVRNSRFTFDTSNDRYWGVYAASPGSSGMGGAPPKPWNVRLENVTFTGRGSEAAAVEINGRPNTVLEDVIVDQRGPHDGVVLQVPTGAQIDGGSFVTGRYPIRVVLDSEMESCPVELKQVDDVRTRQRRIRNHATAIGTDGQVSCLGTDVFEANANAFALTGLCDQGYFAVPLVEGELATPVAEQATDAAAGCQ